MSKNLNFSNKAKELIDKIPDPLKLGLIAVSLFFGLPFLTGLALLSGVYLPQAFNFFHFFNSKDIASAGAMPLFLATLPLLSLGYIVSRISAASNKFILRFAVKIIAYGRAVTFVFLFAVAFGGYWLMQGIAKAEECKSEKNSTLEMNYGKSEIMLPSSSEWMLFYDQKSEGIISKERPAEKVLHFPSPMGEQWQNSCLSRISWFSRLIF